MSNEKNARESEIKVSTDLAVTKADENVDEKVDKMVKSFTDPEPQFTCKLRKPVTYNGIEYDELSFDFETLSGEDGLNIESELAAMGKVPILDPMFDGNYLIRMAARACTEPISVELLLKLSISDFNKIRNKSKYFLLNTVREET